MGTSLVTEVVTIQYALQDCISGLCCSLCWTACVYHRIPRMVSIQECRACSHCSLCRTSCSCWWQLCTRPTELAGSAAGYCCCRSRSSQETGSGCWVPRMASIQECRACTYCPICWTSCCSWQELAPGAAELYC